VLLRNLENGEQRVNSGDSATRCIGDRPAITGARWIRPFHQVDLREKAQLTLMGMLKITRNR